MTSRAAAICCSVLVHARLQFRQGCRFALSASILQPNPRKRFGDGQRGIRTHGLLAPEGAVVAGGGLSLALPGSAT